MAAVKALPIASRCISCHHNTLSTFASLAGLSIRHAPHTVFASSKPWLLSARHYSFTKPRSSEVLWRAEGNQNENLSQQPSQRPQSPKNTDESIPWYLQEIPDTIASPLSERQKLPDLPPDPPESLQAISEHLSIDIGLDDLTLLDLRKLDPPPALGSNLIMLFGTARSEKHLHVAADRFCRWLRTTYKLSPYADGLLGRNELKIKLRRKARRAKLLGGTRARDQEQDDGIRTDWVCVNVGAIEETVSIERSLEPEGIEGFGGREDGAKLVVQMFTEEKREKLDLEHLWTRFLRRQERKEGSEAEKLLKESAASTVDKVKELKESLPNTRLSQQSV